MKLISIDYSSFSLPYHMHNSAVLFQKFWVTEIEYRTIPLLISSRPFYFFPFHGISAVSFSLSPPWTFCLSFLLYYCSIISSFFSPVWQCWLFFSPFIAFLFLGWLFEIHEDWAMAKMLVFIWMIEFTRYL